MALVALHLDKGRRTDVTLLHVDKGAEGKRYGDVPGGAVSQSASQSDQQKEKPCCSGSDVQKDDRKRLSPYCKKPNESSLKWNKLVLCCYAGNVHIVTCLAPKLLENSDQATASSSSYCGFKVV